MSEAQTRVERTLDIHFKEDEHGSGCSTKCGYVGRDRVRHLAEEIVKDVLEPLAKVIDPETLYWRSGVSGMLRVSDIWEVYPELAPPISDTAYPGAPS